MKSFVAPLIPPTAPKISNVSTKVPDIMKKPNVLLEDSSDDDLGESLMERMQKKLVVSPPPKPLKENNKKRPSPRMDGGGSTELDAFFVDSDTQPKPTKAAKKPSLKPKATGTTAKKAFGAKKTLNLKKFADSDSEDDFDFPPDNDDEIADSKVKAPPVRVRAARTATTKKPVVYALSSDDDSDAEFSD